LADILSIRFEDATVNDFVGHQGRVFTVHRHVLCEVSAYFNAALNGNSEESVNDEIDLPEQEPGLFNRFIEWAYQGKIDVVELKEKDGYDHEVWMSFSKLYLLARYLQCPEFGNCVLDNAPSQLCSDSSNQALPDEEIARMAYDSTVQKCGIRSYFVAPYV
jgi:BTB/POZ domain